MTDQTGGYGGIGRRGRFRFCWQPRAGSSPVIRMRKSGCLKPLFLFHVFTRTFNNLTDNLDLNLFNTVNPKNSDNLLSQKIRIAIDTFEESICIKHSKLRTSIRFLDFSHLQRKIGQFAELFLQQLLIRQMLSIV